MPRRKPVNPQPSKKDDEEENPADEGPSPKKPKGDKIDDAGAEPHAGGGELHRHGALTRSAAARTPTASPQKTTPASADAKVAAGKKGKGKIVKPSPGKVVVAAEVAVPPEIVAHAPTDAVITAEAQPPAEYFPDVSEEQTETGAPREDAPRENLSMEALLQAANSELANFKQVGQGEMAGLVAGGAGKGELLPDAAALQQLVAQNQEIIYVTLPSQSGAETPHVELPVVDVMESPKDKPVTTILRLDGAEAGAVQMPLAGQQTYRLVYAKNPVTSAEAGLAHKPLILKSARPQDGLLQQPGGIVLQKPIVMAPAAASTAGRKRKHPAKPGKHICSYCGRGCAKPSVLEKHIRAHTGERPYPCTPCGFSFKTKSNLYKHCKSRSHAIKAGLARAGEGELLPGQSSTDREDEDLIDDDMEDMEDMESAEGSAMDDGESNKSEESGAREGGVLLAGRVESEGTPKQRFKKKMKEEQKEKESVAQQQQQQRFVLVQQPGPGERPTEDFTAAQNLLMTETSHKVEGAAGMLRPAVSAAPGKVTGAGDKPVMWDVVFYNQDGNLVPAIRSTPNTFTVASSPQVKMAGTPMVLPARPREVVQEDAAIAVRVASNSSLARELPVGVPQIQMLSAGPEMAGLVPDTPTFPVAMPVTPQPADPAVSAVRKLSDKQMKVTIQLPKPGQRASSATPSTPVPRLPPVDTNNLTPEALQERIAMLISVNSQIVDTPMADAPRPKRVSRQNSEPVSKSFAAPGGSAMKQLLSSQLSTTIAPATLPISSLVSASSVMAGSSLVSTSSLVAGSSVLGAMPASTFLLPAADEPVDPQKGVEMTLIDVTPRGAPLEMIQDIAPRQQQHFLGLAEPSDQPPGTQQLRPTAAMDCSPSPSTSSRGCDLAESGGHGDGVGHGEEHLMGIPSIASDASPPEIKIKFQLEQMPPPQHQQHQHVEPEGQTVVIDNVPGPGGQHEEGTGDPNPEGSLIKDLLLQRRMMPPITKSYSLPAPGPAEGDAGEALEAAPPGTLLCEGCNVGFEQQEQLEIHKRHLCPMSQTQTVPGGVPVVEAGDRHADAPDGSLVILMNEDGGPESIITEVAKEVELSSCASPEDKKKVETPNTNVILEIVDPKLPPKRGRPKGSRNRPKDQAVVKLASLNVTQAQQLGGFTPGLSSTPISAFSPISVTPLSVTSALATSTPLSPKTPDTPSSQSLWKLKLKGKLLMKRSMSVERMLSQDKEKMEQLRGAAAPGPAHGMPETMGLNPRKQHPGLLQRSHSVDAVGLNKKKPRLIRDFSLQEESYDPSLGPGVAVLPAAPGAGTFGGNNHTLNPPHEIVVIDENNQATEVIVVHERGDGLEGADGAGGKRGFQPPVNEAVQHMHNTPPLFAPNINMKDQSVRLPHVLNVPVSLAQKIPGLVQGLPAPADAPRPAGEEPVEVGNEGGDAENDPDAKALALIGSSSGGVTPPPAPTHHAVNLTGISKLLQEKVLVALLLLGHNYPSMDNTACATFCSVLKTQPMYVPQGANRKISMYSNWRTAGFNPNPMGLTTKQMLGLYRTANANYTDPAALERMADISAPKSGVLTHSSYWNFRKLTEGGGADDSGSGGDGGAAAAAAAADVQFMPLPDIVHVANDITVQTTAAGGERDPEHAPTAKERLKEKLATDRPARVKIFPGGFKSNEDYTYVRGRGRGKYVCEECGIRCKKPSMLKKHIRTHTDLRPYNCQYCRFSFKTKGNLTKHMKSKAHHKLCTELGLDPVPTAVDESFINSDVLMKQALVDKGRALAGGAGEEDDEEEDDDGDEEGDMEYEEVEEEEEMDETIVVDIIDKDSVAESPEKSADAPGTPKYVALQQPDSAQPTFVRLSAEGDPIVYTPDANSVHVAVNKTGAPDDGSPRASIDKEIAASLLDLSKGREKEAAAEGDGDKGESKEDTRLDQLIVALVSRTGDKIPSGPAKTANGGETPVTSLAVQSAEDSHATIKALLTTPAAPEPGTAAATHQAALVKSGFVPPIFIMSGAGLVQIQSPLAAGCVTTPTFTRQDSLSTLIPSLRNVPQPPGSKKVAEGGREAAGRAPAALGPKVAVPVTAEKREAAPPRPVTVPLTILGLEGAPTVTPEVRPVSVTSAGEGGVPAPLGAAYAVPTSSTSVTSVTSVPVKYVTSENRAPFEIMPIPLRVQPSPETVDGKYVCDICRKSFSKQHQLIMHRNIHYFERPFKCEDCNLSFKSKALLDKHVRSESHVAKVSLQQQFGPVSSVNPRPFKCDDCSAAFRIHGHLAKHLRSKLHFMKLESLDKIPPGSFAVLEKSHFTGVSFVDSETSLESIQRVLECIAEGGTPPVEDAHAHAQGESGEAPSPDGVPARRGEPAPAGAHTSPGRDNFLYQRFGEFEKDDTRSNENVTVEFTNKPIELGDIVHNNTQQRQDDTGDIATDSEGAHKCGICGKTFKEISRLKEHLVTHAELRPYVCEYCDAGFTNAQSLKFHLRTHTQERPYICGMCGDTFARSDHLRRHMLTHERGHMSSRTGLGSPPLTSVTPVILQAKPGQAGRSAIIHGQPTILQGQPALIQGQPALIQGQPAILQGQPAILQGQHAIIQGQPGILQGQPAIIQGQPALIHTQTGQVTSAPVFLQAQSGQSTLLQSAGGNQLLVAHTGSQPTVRILPPLSGALRPQLRAQMSADGQSPVTFQDGVVTMAAHGSAGGGGEMVVADTGGGNVQVIEVNPQQFEVQNITEVGEDGVEKQTQVLILHGGKDMDLGALESVPGVFLAEDGGEIVIAEVPGEQEEGRAGAPPGEGEPPAPRHPATSAAPPKPSDERSRRKFRRSEAIDATSYEEAIGSIVVPGGDVFEPADVSSTDRPAGGGAAPNRKRPAAESVDEDYASKYRVLDNQRGQCSLEPMFAPDTEENA